MILYIMVGIGFAGKSTLAKQIAEYKKAVLVGQDDIWFEKEKEKEKEWNLDEDSDEDWDKIVNISKEKVRQNLAEGKSVVFDHVNLRHSHRGELRNMAKDLDAQAVVIYLDTPLDIRKERKMKNKETGERHDVKQEYVVINGVPFVRVEEVLACKRDYNRPKDLEDIKAIEII